MLLGALIFIFIYGYNIIDPLHIEWNMSGTDRAFHFLGWHFFRFEPWYFPLGIIEKYRYPVGSCIVYMDAIPLIGIPLKLFNAILPQQFQYMGLWLMTTYMLQGFFAAILLKKISNNWRLILLGVTFFIISPILFWRAGGHEALAAHWLILAGLSLYLSPEKMNSTKVKWVFLIIVSSMVHFYLLVMVLAIWAGYLLKELLNDFTRQHTVQILQYIFFTMIILLFVMWVIGYFTIPINNTKTFGFGYYSMNLLAPFTPEGGGKTTFLVNIKFATKGQYEGYNYLGLGILILIFFALYRTPQAIKDIHLKTFFPIAIVVFFLFLFALSNKLTFGSEVLFEFKYPWILEDLGSILRASGRMFWPAYYLLMLVIISVIIKYYSSKTAFILLSAALLIQIVDFYPWYSTRSLGNKTYKTSLQSSKWQKIADSVKHVVMIPPSSNNYRDFALYAANNHLDINIGNVARMDRQKSHRIDQKLMKNFNDSILQKETLYIVDKKNVISPSKENKKKYLFGLLDNYYIIIPKSLKLELNNWFDGNTSNFGSKK